MLKPVLFSFLSMGMNSFQKAQAEALGPSPVPAKDKIMTTGQAAAQPTSDVPIPDEVLRLIPVVQRPVLGLVVHRVAED